MFTRTIRFGALTGALALLGACGGSSGESADTSLNPLGSATVFRTILPTTTTLSADVAGSVVAGLEPGDTYTIISGDFPILVSKKLGCPSWELLAAYNEISPESADFPFPGKVLTIAPDCAGEPIAEVVTEDSVTPTETSAAPPTTGADGSFAYTVQAGDYPIGIATNFDCAWSEIAALNGLTPDGSDFPFPGDVIQIPGTCQAGA